MTPHQMAEALLAVAKMREDSWDGGSLSYTLSNEECAERVFIGPNAAFARLAVLALTGWFNDVMAWCDAQITEKAQ